MSLHQFPCVPFVSTGFCDSAFGWAQREIEQIAFRLYILYVLHVCKMHSPPVYVCVCVCVRDRTFVCICVRLMFVRDAYL
jgi:hypothetical protein